MKIWLLSCVVLLACATTARANDQSFDSWLDEFRVVARQQNISAETLDAAFANVQPIDRVLELDRAQPESTLTRQEYLTKTVNAKRIRHGRELLAIHRVALQKIEAKYGVPKEMIVALWGIETSYGTHTGGFGIIPALTTLAYDGRRSEFFRAELMNALRILDQDHIALEDFKGSWAGAMGQCQFMPSSFLKFAVDENGDGKRDIWNTQEDVFASIANYLASSGWKKNLTWGGGPVRLREEISDDEFTLERSRSYADWNNRGVGWPDTNTPFAQTDAAYLITIGKDDQEGTAPYLVSDNFKILLLWNRSRYFAAAVGTLADALRDGNSTEYKE